MKRIVMLSRTLLTVAGMAFALTNSHAALETSTLSLKGTGTASDPYQVATVADWEALAAHVSEGNNLADSHIKLMNDIDFDGKSIAPVTAEFSGNLNGAGFTFKNFTLTPTANSQSIFLSVTASGSVSNLSLNGIVTATDPTYVAGLVGTLYGKLDHVTNYSSVTGKNAAGLVGTVETGASLSYCVNKGKISVSAIPGGGLCALTKYGAFYTNCVNEGTVAKVAGVSAFGGITGTSGNATFINCSNVGKFELDSLTFYVGGIVGNANGISDAAAPAPLTIKNCFNTADILGKGFIGGIVGGRQYGNNKPGMDIQDCYNTGNLRFPNGAYNSYTVGGIIGQGVQGNIINCYNTGKISGTRTPGVGGIFGKIYKSGTDTTSFIMRNCYNTGDIEMETSCGMAGGIGGYLFTDSRAVIENCYNTGNVKATYTVGGIIGQVDKINNTIRNCWNRGNVEAELKWAGGIIGSTIKSTTKVEYCWNGGNVSTPGTLGGEDTKTTTATGNAIGGIIGRSGAKISNCYNLGSVKGASQVGGIVGLTELDSAQVSKCYNIGEILAPADTCGAIIGINTINNPTRWGAKNMVEDSYYATDGYAIGTNNLVGTAKTMSQLASGTFDMGEGWVNVGSYCTPTFTSCNSEPAALLGVAQMVTDGDNYTKVTRSFKLGTPTGVAWTSNNGVVTINGNKGIVDPKSKEVAVILTATAGDYSKQLAIIVDGASSIEALENNAEITGRQFYTLDGVAVTAPECKDGKAYIVILHLSDGSRRAIKIAN